jgi:Outer membrane protein beta-barrel family/CarboxypepD_reg-like domain
MKNLILCLLMLPFAAFSQKTTVAGTVKSPTNAAVSFVNIVLKSNTNPEKFYTAITKKNGFFEISNVANDSYILTTSIIGFNDFEVAILVNDKNIDQIIVLKPTEQLSEVVVAQKKPIIKRKADRLEFNIENTILSSQNAYDILKKTPEVLVNQKGISVRGSFAVLITINGRKTNLTGDELKNLLESTDGADIKLIEVITNPSAKYDAAGSAIINLKMINNTKEGYTGRAATVYDQGIYAKNNISTRHFYKSKKWAIMGGYRLGTGTNYYENNDVVVYETALKTWRNDIKNKENNTSSHDLQFSSDFAPDTLNVFKIGANLSVLPNNTANNNNPTNIFDIQNQLTSYFNTTNISKTKSANKTFFMNYEHLFSKNSTISFAADYAIQDRNNNQNVFTDQFGFKPNSNFISENDNKIKVFSSQVDYNFNSDKFAFETGIKLSKINTVTALDFNNLLNAPFNSNTTFDYQELVHAGYFNFSKKINHWSLKTGLRIEATKINSFATNPATENDTKYLNFFPSVSILRQLENGNSIGFNYGKRIERPEYQSLNPSKLYYSNYTYLLGDMNLKPTYIDNYSLIFTLHDKFNFDFYYRFEKNPVHEISVQNNASPQVVYQFTNIEKNEALGLDFTTVLEPKAWWSIGVQSTARYDKNNFIGVDSKLYQNNILVYSTNINQTFYINEPKGFIAEISYQYTSKSVQGPINLSARSNVEIGLRKKLFQNKGEITLFATDIFKGEKYNAFSKYANQNNSYTEYNDSQRLMLTFKYKFGNQKIKPKTDKEKTDEQKRLGK